MRKPSEIIVNGKTLEKILEDHKHWLKEDIEGWEDMRADLSDANSKLTASIVDSLGLTRSIAPLLQVSN